MVPRALMDRTFRLDEVERQAAMCHWAQSGTRDAGRRTLHMGT
ncbi:MAG: hypothetical protein OXI95_01680 [bacterium]|nr:hypothetical protein [bacterium]